MHDCNIRSDRPISQFLSIIRRPIWQVNDQSSLKISLKIIQIGLRAENFIKKIIKIIRRSIVWGGDEEDSRWALGERLG